MSSGCCYKPGIYIACDEADWADMPTNWLDRVWSLPQITIFTLEPQLPTVNKIRHSDSNGIEVALCSLRDVTYNVTVTYVQCYPGMQFYVRQGDIWDARLYPFLPTDHNTVDVDLESEPYYSLLVKTQVGTLTYDHNNTDGQISTFVFEGQDILVPPNNDTTLGAYATSKFGACTVNFAAPLTWPDDGSGPPAIDFKISQFTSAEQVAVNAIVTLPAAPYIGLTILVLYQHTMVNYPALTDKKSIVSWIYNGLEYASPSFVTTQEVI
jgi:hypothetical protein